MFILFIMLIFQFKLPIDSQNINLMTQKSVNTALSICSAHRCCPPNHLLPVYSLLAPFLIFLFSLAVNDSILSVNLIFNTLKTESILLLTFADLLCDGYVLATEGLSASLVTLVSSFLVSLSLSSLTECLSSR